MSTKRLDRRETRSGNSCSDKIFIKNNLLQNTQKSLFSIKLNFFKQT